MNISQVMPGASDDSIRSSMEQRLRGKEDPEQVKFVSQQFEAILVRQILNTAHIGAAGAAGGSGESKMTSEVYRDLMINQLADQISGTGELGLGRQLAQEMQQRKPVTDESTLESSARSRRVH